MAHAYKGHLISLEGIDGSGKSTLARGLAAALTARGLVTLLTKEPGGTSLGASLRTILHTQKSLVCDLSEYFLFAADRAQHFHEIVIPALEAGTIVIADRLADSSLAYQGYGRGLDKTMITSVNQWAMLGVRPDLTFYLHLDPATAMQRIHNRQEQLTSFEQEKLAFWQRVTHGYETIFADRTNVVRLDATMLQKTLCELAEREVLRICGV